MTGYGGSNEHPTVLPGPPVCSWWPYRDGWVEDTSPKWPPSRHLLVGDLGPWTKDSLSATGGQPGRREDQLHASPASGGFLVNWKTDLRLSDLDGAAPLEIVCRVCGQTRTETAEALLREPALKQAYLDEVERALKCAGRFCRGPV